MKTQEETITDLSTLWEDTLVEISNDIVDFHTKMKKIKILAGILKQRIDAKDLDIDQTEICSFITQTCIQRKLNIHDDTIRKSLPDEFKRPYGEKSRIILDYFDAAFKGVDKENNIINFTDFEKSVSEHFSTKDKKLNWYDSPYHVLFAKIDHVKEMLLEKIEADPEKFTPDSLTGPEKYELSEFFDMADVQQQELDDRFEIVSTDAPKYLLAVTLGSISRVGEKYHRFIKETHKLSTKQITKFIRGKSRHSPLGPKNSKEAIQWGYTGKQCPQCQSFRWEEKVNTLTVKISSYFSCYQCGHKSVMRLSKNV